MTNRLNNLELIRRVDRENMLRLLLEFPEQCEDAFRLGRGFRPPSVFRRIEKIVFTGLGGSAIGAELIKTYLAEEVKVPIVVNRDYRLPSLVDRRTLVVASSYSGNTEETLSAYRAARKQRARIIAITSGGKLKTRAVRDGNPCLTIPTGFPPRCALGYSFFTGLTVLEKIGLIESQRGPVKDAIETLVRLRVKEVRPELSERSNPAKRLARQLQGYFPVVYAAERNLAAVATRWRSQLAENAKTLSSSHLFPEMNHNEIMGWEFPRKLLKNMIVVILRDRDDYRRVKKRIAITASILRKEAKAVIEVESQGKSRLARMFSLVFLGDFTSFYLAVLNGRDPTPVERITYLKKELAKK